MKAWHFLPETHELYVGHTSEVEGEIIPEKWGLHASKRVLQAAFWAPSLTLCRVELSGTIVEGDRKLAASRRKVLWMGDITEPFWEWAIERARAVVSGEEKAGRFIEKSLVNAFCACVAWRDGKISFEEMLKYRGPARTAARKVLGKNARNQTKGGAQCEGAQRAALCLSQLTEGKNAHRVIAACPQHLENTPVRLAECNRLEQLIVEHSKKGWFMMSEVEPPKGAYCHIQRADDGTHWKGKWMGGGFAGVGMRADEILCWRLVQNER